MDERLLTQWDENVGENLFSEEPWVVRKKCRQAEQGK
jgi:hypothetical protein